MRTQSDEYRQMAERARSEAASAQLPNVQQVHLRSADRLDQMAQEIENAVRAKA